MIDCTLLRRLHGRGGVRLQPLTKFIFALSGGAELFTFSLAGTPSPLIFWNHGIRATLPPRSLSY